MAPPGRLGPPAGLAQGQTKKVGSDDFRGKKEKV